MSVQRARKTLRGESADRIALFDLPEHPGLIRFLSGIDAFTETERGVSEAVKALDVDLLMCSIPEQTNASASDEHLIAVGSTKWRNEETTSRDLFHYDPAIYRTDCACLSEDACTVLFQGYLDRNRRLTGGAALPIGYCFTTCIHYAAEDLNWPDFLMACMTEEEKVSLLLDKFQSASEKIMRAWSRTDAEIMLCHDDIANSRSTNLSPDWIRRNLIPRYADIFKPLKKKGVPIIFMTDGNFSEVARDLKDAGADGFFLDPPCISLETLVSLTGPDLIYFTGPTPATLTVGTPEDVRREMRQLAAAAKHLPRFFFHIPGGHMHNMPLENILTFYDCCKNEGMK